VEFNNVLDVEETEDGILARLRSQLVKGRDFEVKIGNAQGDMATLTSLVDSALADRADMLITMSTPTLQVALRRAQRIPVVFTYVASAVAAGAGRP
jgi:putative tryptophan/tyrosine transport system substrate-binding protein